MAPPRRGEHRPKAHEVPPTLSVAGIYGANASGKSNVLNALRWMRDAVTNSHIHWQPGGGVPRRSFGLDDTSAQTPSFYELDLVLNGVRHTYGFEVTNSSVVSEWLFAFPHGRPQRLFERDGTTEFRFGRALTGQLRQIERMTRENSLYLSTAASSNHGLLSRLHSLISRGIDDASHRENDLNFARRLTEDMFENRNMCDTVQKMMRIADLGISGMEFAPKEINEKAFSFINSIDSDLKIPKEVVDDIRKHMSRELVFTHDGASAGRTIPLTEESDGTRAWFSLLGPLVGVLRGGKVFLVDEIDSSLHPVISSTLIRMFKDPSINPRGAQLVFASHDTTLLGSMLHENLLNRDEVWFTEKDSSGSTSLFSLEEFRARGEENFERGYLQGRYGAVPFVDFEQIRQLFQKTYEENIGEEATAIEAEPHEKDIDP